MTIMSIFVFVCGAAASQWIADAVKASLPPGRLSSWLWAVLLQYVICTVLLIVIDRAAIGAALQAAPALTFLVRWIYFMKRLKAA